MNLSKIILGTAQLGMNYGIANLTGKPDFNKSINIIRHAWKNGINTFDTSPQYGNSEEILGLFISSNFKNREEKPIIISKLPKIGISEEITFETLYNYIKKQIQKSIRNLKVEMIPIYLLHHSDDMLIKDGIVFKCLSVLKEEGLIDKFGASIYTPEQVENILKFKQATVIQLPLNIFDFRLLKNNLLKKLKERGYITIARSIYLQGLIFIHPHKLQENLKIAKEYLLKLRKICSKFNMDIDELAFLYVRDVPEITSLVIGSENINQLKRNLELMNQKPLEDNIQTILKKEFSDLPEGLINPNLWKRK